MNEKIKAKCHPDRPHLAKGLCKTCYESERAKTRGSNRWKDNGEGHKAKCHPERRNFSHGLCKTCHHKKFLEDNPEKKQSYYEKHKQNWLKYTLRNKFDISVEDYDRMLKEQNGVCAICGQPESSDRQRLSVDHNHETGEIRGLLCQKCNTMVGMSLEKVSILESAIRFLQRSKK